VLLRFLTYGTFLGRVRIRPEHSSRRESDQPRSRSRSHSGSPWHSGVNPAVFFILVFLLTELTEGFGVARTSGCRQSTLALLRNDDSSFTNEGFEEGAGDDGELIPDLEWRLVKAKLEEAHTKSFLKSKPRYLPYAECRKWVMAWDRWSCEEEWKEWIDMGEKRNSYIPARPDEYYGALGQWISWDHFLGTGVNGDVIGEFD
jgi:hypothetical protein